jgi:exopolyphosphatase/guanosine-5'-triphosphate,3'-diphosphate pyrophosphatase
MDAGTITSKAVIDIGSNSVRLVIYDALGCGLLPHYNEKVMAQLGDGVRETGTLSDKGVMIALKALARYQAILEGLGVSHVRTVATAAVRLADDGAVFIDRVKHETGLVVEIISGAEEARLSALGVSAGFNMVSGLVGDLGGSSLEFCTLEKGHVGRGESLVLGPLAMDARDVELSKLSKSVERELAKSDLLKGHGGSFFMVGGAWRALAKMHMELVDYPLRQLHHYRMDASAVRLLVEASMSDDALNRERRARASRRRADILPYAGMVLGKIFELGEFSEIIVSAYGLREGAIVSDARAADVAGDGLTDGVLLSGRLRDETRAFGKALAAWSTPIIRPQEDLFGEPEVHDRLIAAACLHADFGARLHPDTRAQLAFERVLYGAYANVSHAERAFIALAVGYRYSHSFKAGDKAASRLLNKRQLKLARQLGACMRLGAVFSGRSAAVLGDVKLSRSPGLVTLTVSKGKSALVSSTVQRRLQTLAELLDCDWQIARQ